VEHQDNILLSVTHIQSKHRGPLSITERWPESLPRVSMLNILTFFLTSFLVRTPPSRN
jgi:hypothetical protein